MAAAVRRLSPVTMTVLMPICRSSAKRSRIPPLTMSRSSTTPSTRRAFGDHQRRRALPRRLVDDPADRRGPRAALGLDEAPDRVRRALAQAAALEVDAADARLGRELVKRVRETREVAAAQLESLLGEHHDRPALRRLVGERRELGDVREVLLRDARGRVERRGLPVAERDGAGLVEQQHVDVAGRLDRAAGGGDDVGPHHAVHARDADGGQQAADRGRDQADEQRHQHHDRHCPRRRPRRRPRTRRTARASPWRAGTPASASRAGSTVRSRWASLPRRAPSTIAIIRSRKESPGSLVTRTTSQSDSTRVPPVTDEKSLPASRSTGADSPVIALSSTEATPSTTSPSAGMVSRASTRKKSPLRRLSAGTTSQRPDRDRLEPPRVDLATRGAQRRRLRLAAALGDGFGEVREQHGEPQPCGDREHEAGAARSCPRHPRPP